jgi:hypothetical protein
LGFLFGGGLDAGKGFLNEVGVDDFSIDAKHGGSLNAEPRTFNIERSTLETWVERLGCGGMGFLVGDLGFGGLTADFAD